MRYYLCITLLIFLCNVAAKSLVAQELKFATVEEARRLLVLRDAYIERMSPFDRAARMKTEMNVGESEFLEFAAAAALNWSQRDKVKIETAYQDIVTTINDLGLPLPEKIYLVKTTGDEEGKAAYTRGDAIFLPVNFVDSDKLDMRRLLAHELFHIATRKNTNLARALYGTIGFEYCGEVILPGILASRKITNPDAPRNDYCIKVRVGEEESWAIPILLSISEKYDISQGGEFFDYLQLTFLLVQRNAEHEPAEVLFDSQAPRLVSLDQITGFFEQVGRNTRYVLHPEEILAENFAMLVTGKGDVVSPAILDKIKIVLLERTGVE